MITISADGAFVTGVHADAIEVTGDSNSVAIDDIAGVRVSGSTNSVFWNSCSSSATDTGSQNTVLGP